MIVRVTLCLCGMLFWVSESLMASCDQGVARVSGAANYPPLNWEEGGRLRGVNVDLVTRLLEPHSVSIETDPGMPWKRLMMAVRAGQVDILVGIPKTDSAQANLLFLEPPVTPAAQGVFYAVNRPIRYAAWDDLKELTGSRMLGSYFDDRFEAYAIEHLHLEQVAQMQHNFHKLLKNRTDYVLGPVATLSMYLEKLGLQDQIVYADSDLLTRNEYIAIARSSSCAGLADTLQRDLRAMLDSGAVPDLMEKHFLHWFEAVP